MKVIVCGAGQVGFNIAKHLSNQNVDVTVIDRSADLIRKISESLDVQALVGFASDPDLLDQANAENADMIIAVTWSDEVNMVACQVAQSLFDVPMKIARIRNQSYLRGTWANLFGRDHLPIDVVISPEKEVAKAISRRLSIPGALDVIPFAEGGINVVSAHLDEKCAVSNTPLRQLTELFPDLFVTILSVIRDDHMFIPTADDHMREGDNIYFAVEASQTRRAMELFGHEEQEARRIIMIGGGNVAQFLAEDLEASDNGINLKIVEMDKERAEKISSKLPKTVVVNGDGLDSEILREVNAQAADYVISIANDDEVNILAALLAKRMGTKKAIALINNPIYGQLLGSLGIDVHVDPRETTVSTIIQHIRRGRIKNLHAIRDGEAEIVEAEVTESSSLVGARLRKSKLPKGIIVGAIIRDDKVFAPRGDLIIQEGDQMVVFVMQEAVKDIEHLFALRMDYY